jgi:hypothetical protein
LFKKEPTNKQIKESNKSNKVEKRVRNEKHSQTLKAQQQQNFIHFHI